MWREWKTRSCMGRVGGIDEVEWRERKQRGMTFVKVEWVER